MSERERGCKPPPPEEEGGEGGDPLVGRGEEGKERHEGREGTFHESSPMEEESAGEEKESAGGRGEPPDSIGPGGHSPLLPIPPPAAGRGDLPAPEGNGVVLPSPMTLDDPCASMLALDECSD